MGDSTTFKLFVSHATKDDSKDVFNVVKTAMQMKDITVFNITVQGSRF